MFSYFDSPAQGHMLPMLDLTHYLSTRTNFTFTILTTPKNLPYISPLLLSSPSISPLVLPFPSHPLIPPCIENTHHLPPSFPAFHIFIHALSSLRAPLFSWFSSIANPPNVIISDFFLGWTQSFAKEVNIPRITFSPSSAMTLSVNHHTWNDMPRRPENDIDTISYPFLPGELRIPWYELSPLYRNYEGDEVVKEGMSANMRSWGVVVNTFERLEGVYVEHLKKEVGHGRVWGVGPVSLLGRDAAERGGSSAV